MSQHPRAIHRGYRRITTPRPQPGRQMAGLGPVSRQNGSLGNDLMDYRSSIRGCNSTRGLPGDKLAACELAVRNRAFIIVISYSENFTSARLA